jgi:hypothetical protein
MSILISAARRELTKRWALWPAATLASLVAVAVPYLPPFATYESDLRALLAGLLGFGLSWPMAVYLGVSLGKRDTDAVTSGSEMAAL